MRRWRIGIDARIFGQVGIGRYNRNLILQLEKVDWENEYVIFLCRSELDLYQPDNPHFRKLEADFPVYSFAEQIFLPWLFFKQRLDLMHFTNFNFPIFYPGRFVITIHDLIHLEHSTFGSTLRFYPYYLFKRLIYFLVMKQAVKRAARIFVPSDDVKKDLIHKLKVNPDKIVVTYEGVDRVFLESDLQTGKTAEAVLKRYAISKPYLLYIATMYPHKNIERLLEAFRRVKDGKVRGEGLNLVLVGKQDYFAQRVQKRVKDEGLEDSVLFPGKIAPDGYVPDEDLKVILANAKVYIFPSLKEGFGLPILEAWATGVPIVCSNISSLSEIGGDACCYFNPYNIVEMAEKIREVIENRNLRMSLIEKGRERLQFFSWEKMARQTLETYLTVLS